MNAKTRSSSVLTLVAIAMTTLALTATSAKAVVLGELGILNGGADLSGQINPATGANWQAGDTYRFIFATSTGRDATSSNIADYNTFVDNAANAGGAIAGLSGTTWNALASTPTVNAIDNTGLTGVKAESFWLVDGTTKIANDYTDFWDGHTSAEAIDVSETGGTPLNNGAWDSLWTGTDPNGNTRANLGLGDPSGISGGGLWGGAASAAQWVQRFTFDQSLTPGPNTPTQISNPSVPPGLALYGVSDVLTVFDPDAGSGTPEPGSLLLAVVGFVGLMGARRRHRRK